MLNLILSPWEKTNKSAVLKFRNESFRSDLIPLGYPTRAGEILHKTALQAALCAMGAISTKSSEMVQIAHWMTH